MSFQFSWWCRGTSDLRLGAHHGPVLTVVHAPWHETQPANTWHITVLWKGVAWFVMSSQIRRPIMFVGTMCRWHCQLSSWVGAHGQNQIVRSNDGHVVHSSPTIVSSHRCHTAIAQVNQRSNVVVPFKFDLFYKEDQEIWWAEQMKSNSTIKWYSQMTLVLHAALHQPPPSTSGGICTDESEKQYRSPLQVWPVWDGRLSNSVSSADGNKDCYQIILILRAWYHHVQDELGSSVTWCEHQCLLHCGSWTAALQWDWLCGHDCGSQLVAACNI